MPGPGRGGGGWGRPVRRAATRRWRWSALPDSHVAAQIRDKRKQSSFSIPIATDGFCAAPPCPCEMQKLLSKAFQNRPRGAKRPSPCEFGVTVWFLVLRKRLQKGWYAQHALQSDQRKFASLLPAVESWRCKAESLCVSVWCFSHFTQKSHRTGRLGGSVS